MAWKSGVLPAPPPWPIRISDCGARGLSPSTSRLTAFVESGLACEDCTACPAATRSPRCSWAISSSGWAAGSPATTSGAAGRARSAECGGAAARVRPRLEQVVHALAAQPLDLLVGKRRLEDHL